MMRNPKFKEVSLLFKALKEKCVNLHTNIWLCLVLILAGLLRFYKLDERCLFGDEVLTLGMISGDSWSQVWLKVTQGYQGDLPLYYIILHYWSLINQSTFWLRCFSVLTSLVSVIIIYKICVYLFDKKTALFVVFLRAISPLRILYAQTIRYYSLVSLFNLVSLYFFIKAVRSNAKFNWFIYILARVISIYINYASLMFFLFGGIFMWAYDKKYPLSCKRWLISALIILGLCFPIWFYFFRDLNVLQAGEGFARLPLKVGFIGNFIYTFFAFSLGQTVSPFNYPVVLIATVTYSFIIISFLRAYFLKRIPREPVNFLLLAILITVSICSFSNYNSPRYILTAGALYGIIIVLGILKAPKKAVIVLIIIVSSLRIYSLYNLYTERQYHKKEMVDSWDDIAVYAHSYCEDSDVIIYNSISFAYYYKQFNAKNAMLVLPENEDEMSLLIKEELTPSEALKIIFVDSPLSGNMIDSYKEEIVLLKEWLEENRFKLIMEKGFDKDKTAYLKRKYISRPFPEYRTKVYIYARQKIKN